MWFTEENLRRMFTYRQWSDAEVTRFRPLREKVLQLAIEFNDELPEGPHKTRAINALHEAVYLMNTAITLNPMEE